MKYLLILLLLSSCAAYRPSHEMLVKKGFTTHKVVAGTTVFDTYSKKLTAKGFTEITYYPGVNEWALWAGSYDYIKFKVDSKKEFNLVLTNH